MDDAMHDPWTDRLSEYLDDELSPGERAAVEAHLADCAGCRELLVELGAVVARAAAVENPPPRDDLWPGIAARIGARALEPRREAQVVPLRRRLTFSVPQLAAAAVALVALGGAGGLLVLPALGGNGEPAPFVVAEPAAAPAAGVRHAALDAAAAAAATTDAAVQELRAALEAGRGRLSPETLRTLETNLAIIDRAIADARDAVAADPANAYLQSHLADVMRRKVMLLQHAAALAAAEI